MGKIERIQVPPEDRERLEKLIKDHNTAQKVVWRARIVALAGSRLIRFLIGRNDRCKERKKPGFARAFVISIGDGINSPFRPFRRRASPERRPASSAFQRPWLPW